jgi:outer membrane immunogenic protein
MKSVILAAALSIVGTGSLFAADLAAYKAPPPAVYDWTGLYFGGHIGGAWDEMRFSDPSTYNTYDLCCNATHLAFLSGPGNLKSTSDSFLGGLQGGANYQIGRLVLGTELEYSWAHLRTSVAGPFANNILNTTLFGQETFSSSSNWIGMATTRLGLARDNWLFYGKAGAAWIDPNYTLTASNNTAVASVASSAGSLSETHVGWTVGTGIEWAFASNWTAKLEYDYTDFGTWSASIPTGGVNNTVGPFSANEAVSVRQNLSEVKFGVNYKLAPGFLFW